MCALTYVCMGQVMGSAVYMPSPCVFVCPFYHESNCGENGKFRLNGPCMVSQLYSHWQRQHKALGSGFTRIGPLPDLPVREQVIGHVRV